MELCFLITIHLFAWHCFKGTKETNAVPSETQRYHHKIISKKEAYMVSFFPITKIKASPGDKTTRPGVELWMQVQNNPHLVRYNESGSHHAVGQAKDNKSMNANDAGEMEDKRCVYCWSVLYFMDMGRENGVSMADRIRIQMPSECKDQGYSLLFKKECAI